MNISIRGAEPKDAKSIRDIRRIPDVLRWMLSSSPESVYDIRKDIIKHESYTIVATDEADEVVGYCKLEHQKNPRQRHKGRISIAVDSSYHNQGIGKMLLNEIIEFSDKQMKLLKLDLTVMEDNTKAIKLYEHFGFVKEGKLLCECISEGKYADVFLMARYNMPLKEE